MKFRFALTALLFLFPLTAHAGQKPYTRIVSLYAAHAENLALMGASKLLVGISEPLEGVNAPVVTARDGAEAIAALTPDLVLARPMLRIAEPGLLEQLERLNIKVVCLQPRSPEELVPYWLELGRLAGHENEAKDMAARFQKGLAELDAKISAIPKDQRKRVFFDAIHRQMKTVSPDSIAAFALKHAGAVNLAASAEPVSGTNIAFFGLEKIVALGDSLDAYIAQQGPMNHVSVEDIRATPGLSSLKAVREGRVYLVDEALTSRPTPRLLDGIREIAASLYPNLFPTTQAHQ